jgi:dTDP-4-dehydrorhamnose reductase
VVTTYAKNPVPLEGVLSVPWDVREQHGIRKLLFAQKPDVVIYLGGSEDNAWVDANVKLADRVFTAGPGDVLHTAEMMSARFFYVSSASLFDGTKGNYLESDTISPMTNLGRLKASGETLVRGRSNTSTILRLSRLVGSAHPWRPSLFDQLRFALESGAKFELRDDEYHSWTPLSSAVAAIEAIVDQAPKNALYHFGGLTRLTPLEMGRLFAREMGYDEKKIAALLVPKKRVLQKGMVHLAEGEKYDYSMNSSAIIRALGVKAYPIEELLKREFTF